MSDLPWLLVYGRFVWPAMMVFAAVVSCLLAWSQARRRGRESVAWGRRELARPASVTDLADGARAVISGVIVVEGDGLPSFDSKAVAAVTTARAERLPDSLKDALDRSASLRATALSLRCDDGALVHLDGPVAVLAGSREVWTGCTLPGLPREIRARVEGADEAGGAMLSNQHVVLATVAAGDRVQAFGRLVSRQDIRSVAVRWALAPAPEPAAEAGDAALAAIPVVYESPGKVSGPMRRALVRAALLGAIGAFAGSVLAGEFANLSSGGGLAGSATVLSREDQPLAFRSVSADLIAAATPFRRTDAIRRITRQMHRDPEGAREVRTVAAAWSLGPDCRVGVEVLARRGRYDEAVAMGERCGDPASRWVAAQVANLAGEHARASRLIEDLTVPPHGYEGQEVFAALAHIYAGRAGLAVSHLRHAADIELARGARSAEREQALRCAAAALDVKAGHAEARRELRARLDGRQGWRCALLLADLEQAAARRVVLDDMRAQHGDAYGWTSIEVLLRIEAGERNVDYRRLPDVEPRDVLERPAEALTGHVSALERAAHEALLRVPDAELTLEATGARWRLAIARSSFETLFGRPDEARRMIALAASDDLAIARMEARPARGSSPADRQPLAELSILVRSRAGEPLTERQSLELSGLVGDESAFAALAHFLGERASPGDPPRTPWTDRFEPGAPMVNWRGLGEGDGVTLASMLQRLPNVEPFLTPTLAFGLRRLASGVEPMRQWVAWGSRSPCWRCQERYAAADLAHTAMAARTLGLRDEMRMAERGLAAMRETLLHRDLAVVALLIESM